ncbi:hypothetical protein GLW05_20840 [Pontibacillus yanchengensis]|uniref:DUF3168 domain-containing protein n=1 Tax=Pontibacillus yanchengensis TaxID=462910 RepID=A0A6I5A6K3_9BACI|nr:hypothetical protein [Pontibacillus yanchengensis]MYL36021.1 hypothetical protein [Pontibacillus yanchengensis]
MSSKLRVPLDEAFGLVVNKIKSLLEGEMKSDRYLCDVKTVSLGERNLNQIRKPALWIFPMNMTLNEDPSRKVEYWSFPIQVMSVYASNDTEEGYLKATDLAARARRILVQDKRMGLSNIVYEVESARFLPTSSFGVRGNDYAAIAEIVVKMTVDESFK